MWIRGQNVITLKINKAIMKNVLNLIYDSLGDLKDLLRES